MKEKPGVSSRLQIVMVAGEGLTAGVDAGVWPGCRGFAATRAAEPSRPLRVRFKSFPLPGKKQKRRELPPGV